MKKLFAGVLVGFVLGVAFLGSVLYVGAVSPPTATKNGDTNGDGSIDISDAVHLLSFLFTGGAEIAQIECPPTPTRNGLVATGQSQCLGEAGLVDCSIPKARGQDGGSQLGCKLEGRFTENQDGTVSDSCTGLQWTKGYVDVDQDGEIIPDKDGLTWLQACQFAVDMSLGGYDDWRLPNISEVLSIINFSEVGNNFGSSLARPYSAFSFPGTWTSNHNGGSGLALGDLSHSDVACNCCLLRRTRMSDKMLFAIVRGPFNAP